MTKLLRFLNPYRFTIIAVMVLVLGQSLAELYLPTLMAEIVDQGIVYGDTPLIVRVGFIMLAVALVGTVVAVASSYLSARVAAGFARDLRNTLFARVESFSLQEFDHFGAATLITRTTNDITQVQQVSVMALRMLISAPMMAIGGIIMAVSKDATLAIVILVAVPLLGAGVALIAKKALPLFSLLQQKLDRLTLVAREGLTGIRVIRAFDRTAHESARFDDVNRDFTDTAIRVNKILAAMMPMMMLCLNYTTIAIIWFGGLRIDAGHMQVGNLMAFIQYVMQIMWAMLMVSAMFVILPRAGVSAARIQGVLATEPIIAEPEAPIQPEAGQQQGLVEFKDVTFSYPGAERPALSHITFTAPPGEITAIIGGIGAGKTTLINLIPRFYDVDSGQILVDGVDVRRLPLAALREKIGLVPQKPILFSGTIGDNIRFGRQDAADHEVDHAAAVAQGTEFITQLDDGFDALVTQGGTNLSGGQRQRLTIARALLRRPAIYIFDDNFSALDLRTEAKLRHLLRDETRAATVIMVAQRVSTIKDADQILVLDEGRLVGRGTHAQLLADSPVYREIVASQTDTGVGA